MSAVFIYAKTAVLGADPALCVQKEIILFYFYYNIDAHGNIGPE